MKMNYVKVEVIIAEEYIGGLREQLNDHGFLHHGNSDNVLCYTKCKHYSRTLELIPPGASSSEGVSLRNDCKVEFRCMLHQIDKVKKVIHDTHPCEHPIVYFIPIID